MNNADVYIIVEGQTEQTFIRELLGPKLGHSGIYLHPVLIGKPGHKGGDIRFERAKIDIGNFLKQRPDTFISTMFDFYGIETSWPGRAEIQSSDTALEKAGKIEKETLSEIKKSFPDLNITNRFIPYIEMHEFEALLFSDAPTLANKIGVNPVEIDNILSECGGPEEINDDHKSSPSKRLQNLLDKKYRKVAMGKTIAEAIGIQTIREKCPHFNEWLERLELLVKD